MATYSPSQAAKMLQMASSSIRNHTNNPIFRPFFSPTATPAPGQARKLTDRDMKVLRFISTETSAGATLESVAEALAAGELESFQWSPSGTEDVGQAENAALQLLPQVFNALQQQVTDKDAEVRQLHERLAAQSQEIGELRGQLAAARDELAFLHSLLEDRMTPHERTLWQRLFGARTP